ARMAAADARRRNFVRMATPFEDRRGCRRCLSRTPSTETEAGSVELRSVRPYRRPYGGTDPVGSRRAPDPAQGAPPSLGMDLSGLAFLSRASAYGSIRGVPPSVAFPSDALGSADTRQMRWFAVVLGGAAVGLGVVAYRVQVHAFSPFLPDASA